MSWVRDIDFHSYGISSASNAFVVFIRWMADGGMAVVGSARCARMYILHMMCAHVVKHINEILSLFLFNAVSEWEYVYKSNGNENNNKTVGSKHRHICAGTHSHKDIYMQYNNNNIPGWSKTNEAHVFYVEWIFINRFLSLSLTPFISALLLLFLCLFCCCFRQIAHVTTTTKKQSTSIKSLCFFVSMSLWQNKNKRNSI